MVKALLIFSILFSPLSLYSKEQKATFAGGCFWCMEPPFDKLKGVKSTVSGYMGGTLVAPTYQQVSGGGTGHKEVVQIIYDDDAIEYDELLKIFWRNINPTDAGGQFVDRGDQYATAIFYHSDKQKDLAKKSKEQLIKNKIYKKPIVTPILKAQKFYPAEDYHQDYYKKNPIRYKFYRYNSGRDKYLDSIWEK